MYNFNCYGGSFMSNYNYEEAKERIESYFKEFIDNMGVNEKFSRYKEDTMPYIVDLLIPYAMENNYWWEEKSIKMAYYQMRHSDFVVDYKDFVFYYEKLMDKKYNPIDFSTAERRKAIYAEANKKYNAKINNKR